MSFVISVLNSLPHSRMYFFILRLVLRHAEELYCREKSHQKQNCINGFTSFIDNQLTTGDSQLYWLLISDLRGC